MRSGCIWRALQILRQRGGRRRQRGNLLELAQQVRPHGPVAIVGAKGNQERVPAPQEDRRGPSTRQADPASESRFFEAESQTIHGLRLAVEHLHQKLGTALRTYLGDPVLRHPGAETKACSRLASKDWRVMPIDAMPSRQPSGHYLNRLNKSLWRTLAMRG